MSSSWSYAVWAVLAVATVALCVLSRRAPGGTMTPARPSVVLARLAADPWLRLLLLAGWGWVGWHLFAR